MAKGNLDSSGGGLRGRSGQLPVTIILKPFSSDARSTAHLREDRLAQVISDHVIPRLLALHSDIRPIATQTATRPGPAEIRAFAGLVTGPDSQAAMDFAMKLRDGGLPLDRLRSELFEPAARYLGELWDQDRLGFAEVTMGLACLQHLVHAFSGGDEAQDHDDRRRALMLSAPGEQHSLGNSMVQESLRAEGWHVISCPMADLKHIAEIVTHEWFGVVGFSAGTDDHIDDLAQSVTAVRESSLNRSVGIMVGGSAFAGRPELAIEINADGTAANAPDAVLLAKRLLILSLLTPNPSYSRA